MLDFSPVRRKEITMAELVRPLKPADLRALTEEMVALELSLIAGCRDADVTFVPVDPMAHDDAAGALEDVGIAWTLGHVIVHVTASSEETAFLAAELARGVDSPERRRSRWEVPWESVTTIAQCRARLAESRRMRLGALDCWPDEPHLDTTHRLGEKGPLANAVELFVRGLSHEDSHLGQIRDIVAQAGAARK